MSDRANLRKIAPGLLLFVLCFWSYSWFAGEFWNWNSSGRLFCTVSILQTGDTKIDPYSKHTGDIAFHNGHYYCDKAPGMSLLALAPVGAVLKVAEWTGLDLSILDANGEIRKAPYGALAWVATFCTSGLLSALAAVAMLHVLTSLSGSRSASLAAVVAVWLGTPLWGWSGCFFGHAVAAAFLTMGFACLVQMISAARSAGWAAGGAFFLSAAIVVEHTAAPASLLIFLWVLFTIRERPKVELVGLFGVGLTAALLAFAPMAVYNLHTWGSAVAVGYQHEVAFEGMKEGFMGITYPKPRVLFELLLGRAPGLLLLAPVLFLLPAGWRLMWREGAKPLAVLTFSLLSYYLLMNASYHYWGGSWCIGPRHVTAALPFLAFPLAFLFREWTGPRRALLKALVGTGILISLCSAAVGMTPPPAEGFQVYVLVLKPFFQGDFNTPFGVFLRVGGFTIVAIYLAFAVPLAAGLCASLRQTRPIPAEGKTPECRCTATHPDL